MKANKEYVPGELVRLMRLIKGIKQKTICRGTSQQAISKLERSKKITKKKFLQIASAFNWSQTDIEYARRLLPPPLRNVSNWQSLCGLGCFF